MAEENSAVELPAAPPDQAEPIEQYLARQQAEEEQRKREPFDTFKQLVRGFADINHLFGPYGRRSRALRFTDTGLCRVCATIGWITGIASAGKEPEAIKLARYFMRELDFLGNYGGTITTNYLLRPAKNDEPDKYLEMPAFLVRLTDDGCPHSFGICWYAYDRVLSYGEDPGERSISSEGTNPCAYRYFMNGGLIYHGSGVETFSIRIGSSDNPWCIHT